MSDIPKVVVMVLGRGKHGQAKNVVGRLRQQTVKPEVWFWDTGEHGGVDADRYHKQVEGERRQLRWDMLRDSDAEYVCVIDDDMAIKSSKLLDTCIKTLMKPENVFSVIGLHGVRIKGDGLYSNGTHIGGNMEDARVDVVKDNFTVLRRNLLRGFSVPDDETEDDIAVCSYVSRSRRRHLLPGGIRLAVGPPAGAGSGRTWDKERRDLASVAAFKDSPPDKRTVFYTAIVGGRDVLKDPLFHDDGCDFVCFADRPLHSKVWDVVRIERTVSDYSQLTGMERALGHRWFGGHQNIVWVDASCRLKRASAEVVDGWLEHASVVSFKDRDRRCAYREMYYYGNQNRESIEIVKEQEAYYREEGLPDAYGLTVPMLIARSNTERTREFFELWWSETCRRSRLGELSFDYCRWKTGISNWWFPKDVTLAPFFDYFSGHPRWVIDVLIVKGKMGPAREEVFNRMKVAMEENEHLLVSVLEPGGSGFCLAEARNRLLRQTSQPIVCVMDTGAQQSGQENDHQIDWEALYEKLMKDDRAGVVIPARNSVDTFPRFSAPKSEDYGVMVMRREHIEGLGGFDETCSDEDSEKGFLLKTMEKGLSVLSHNWSSCSVAGKAKELDAQVIEMAKEEPAPTVARPVSVSVVIPFYNYHDEGRLVENHVKQVEHLLGTGVDVLTVELACKEDGFTLPDCGGRKIKLLSDTVLWHKESLINLGAKSCDSQIISWHDSGCILDDDWVQKATQAMEDHDLIQCFSRALWIPKNGRGFHRFEKGIVRACREGGLSHVYGGAWAARREFFEDVGLYSGCVIGGGDVALAALLGETVYQRAICAMSPLGKVDYDQWFEKATALGLRIGYFPGKFLHLWHGEYHKRRYADRHRTLKGEGFDPATDLTVAENGTLSWASDKSRMHREIRGYFYSRRI